MIKEIKVYGTGCKSCSETERQVKDVAERLGVAVNVEKVKDLEKIMTAGVMNPPGVSVDGEVKHTGSIPSEDIITKLLQA